MPTPYESEEFFQQILVKAVNAGASDIHLKVGQPPGARIRGDMVYFKTDKLRPDDTEAIARHVIRDAQVRATVPSLKEYDTSYPLPGAGRFRVNVYRQRGTLAVVMRAIPTKIPTFEQLGVPPAIKQFADKDRGLVLVVGAAGNGKSSTLAALIGEMNRTRALHIITIEDPIEFLHEDMMSSVSQREVGLDTVSFAPALRSSLRQDPDVILVGEIRDEETMDIALKAAETGHLVLSTLHTPDVSRTVGRMLALSPSANVGELRERIGDNLQGIVAQRLLPKKDNSGLVLAMELMVATGTVRESIKRPEQNPTLKECMEKGTHPYGMQTFEMHLKQLVMQGLMDKDVAKQAMTF